MASPTKKNRLSAKELEELKETIRKLIEQGQIAEAHKGLQEYRLQNPGDPEHFTLAAVIFILAGRLKEAETELQEGLKRDPGNCDMLFNLAILDEKRNEYISALDLYKRAELVAKSKQQKDDIQIAVQRTMKHIRGSMTFKEDAYIITLEGNERPIKLGYDLNSLVARKQILEAILQNLDTTAQTVLELECEEWVVSKNLADLGFKVRAFTPDARSILKFIGVEFQEKMRTVGVAPPQYYQVKLDKQIAKQVTKSDVITLLPGNISWYKQWGGEAAGQIIATLAHKAKRQLFFHIPQAEETEQIEESLMEILKKEGLPKEKLFACWKGEDGSRLYRLDWAPEISTNRAEIIPGGLDAVDSKAAIFEVQVEKCRDLNGMAYNQEGWNHFVALLQQYQNNPELKYKHSVLKDYFDRFTPCNRQEQLFEKEDNGLPPLSEGWTLLPWMNPDGVLLNPEESPKSRPGGNHHYGPNSEEFGKKEFKKIIDTFTMIKRFGYHPEIFPDGHIQGYFLKDGNDYRFIVSEGQHRMAALGVLGYKVIQCKHNPRFKRVVDIKNINLWPLVKSGLYSIELAERVFRHYFESNGRSKAEHIGLL